jgi:hypothetical protein
MILDAILLTLAEISSTQKRGVVILPEMRIAQGNGVKISHPNSGYESWFSGNADYVVIEYEDVRDYKSKSDYQTLLFYCFMAFSDRLISPGGSREDAFNISKGCLFFIKAKRQSLEQSHIPEAVSRAVVLLRSTKCVNTVCLTSLFAHCLPAFQRSISVYLMGRHGFSLS